MYAFDIDGTLAAVNFNNLYSQEQLLGRYKDAEVLYTPADPFVAVTARGIDPMVERITRDWIKTHFSNCEGVYFASGSEEEKLNYKAETVKRLGLDGYVDTDTKTLEMFSRFRIKGIDLYHLTLSTGVIKLYKRL